MRCNYYFMYCVLYILSGRLHHIEYMGGTYTLLEQNINIRNVIGNCDPFENKLFSLASLVSVVNIKS
ncbi:unnamed protein product [Trifolium pratense]|uniref:Uncharacterized protein n=1 Tax=Trifolium pratense TaxID=57577 RepID=A0ACB0KJY1_TRIPR|nr:unnamed protein product [Trifolium pratense]